MPNNNAKLEQAILEALTEDSYTAYDLMTITQAPRSSVYIAIKELVNTGKIRNITPHRTRNAKYALGSYDGPNSIMPSMRWNNELYKASYFLLTERSVVLEPYRKLFLGLAMILRAAEGLNMGRTLEETELALRRSKAMVIEARNEFDALAKLANQILDEPKFWNPIYLEKFNHDADGWRPQYHNDMINKFTSQGREGESEA